VTGLADHALEAAFWSISTIGTGNDIGCLTIAWDSDRAELSNRALFTRSIASIVGSRLAHGIMPSRALLALVAGWALHAVGGANVREVSCGAVDWLLVSVDGKLTCGGDLAMHHSVCRVVSW